MTRLHPSQLAGLAPDVTQPRYARTNLHPGIVHLGTGAFHRGHLAVVNEAAIHASDDLRWGTVGVALQTLDLCDTLAPQARLYTVTLRDIAQDGSPRETVQVVGNLMDVLFAPDNPMAVMERIAHPDTRIVSLTIAGESKSKSESDPHDPAVGSPGSPGRPAWSHGGARFVEHARPFEILKLRMVDGGHSALAYLGAMASLGTVDCVLAVPTFHRYLSGLMREEIAPTLPPLLDLDLNDYRSRLLDRLANPALQHQTHQIAANGSQKVPRRLLDTVRDRLSAHQPFDRLALAVAAWIHYLGGVDETGSPHVIHDPLAGPLAERLVLTTAATSVHDRIQAFIDFKPVFGDLGQHPRFVTEVARHALSLQVFGVINTLESLP